MAQSRVLPEELLYRFNADLVLLRYPSQEETQELYQQTGIATLAAQLGYRLDPDRHDWKSGGVRTLEELATKLLIKARSAQSGVQHEL